MTYFESRQGVMAAELPVRAAPVGGGGEGGGEGWPRILVSNRTEQTALKGFFSPSGSSHFCQNDEEKNIPRQKAL